MAAFGPEPCFPEQMARREDRLAILEDYMSKGSMERTGWPASVR